MATVTTNYSSENLKNSDKDNLNKSLKAHTKRKNYFSR